jgi:hypothetical protein
MRRQRVLERVGWRFWRCFASSFYRDTDRVMADLFGMLSRLGIEPVQQSGSAPSRGRYTEYRVMEAAGEVRTVVQPDVAASAKQRLPDDPDGRAGGRDCVAVDDKIIVLFGDDQRRISLRLTENTHDLERGLLSSATPFGKAVHGAEEGDEIVFHARLGAVAKPRARPFTLDGEVVVCAPVLEAVPRCCIWADHPSCAGDEGRRSGLAKARAEQAGAA